MIILDVKRSLQSSDNDNDDRWQTSASLHEHEDTLLNALQACYCSLTSPLMLRRHGDAAGVVLDR